MKVNLGIVGEGVYATIVQAKPKRQVLGMKEVVVSPFVSYCLKCI